jgi:hypothetical protein
MGALLLIRVTVLNLPPHPPPCGQVWPLQVYKNQMVGLTEPEEVQHQHSFVLLFPSTADNQLTSFNQHNT